MKILADNEFMKTEKGYTIAEMSELLNLSKQTIKKRIEEGGYKPIELELQYSQKVLDAIKNVSTEKSKKIVKIKSPKIKN